MPVRHLGVVTLGRRGGNRCAYVTPKCRGIRVRVSSWQSYLGLELVDLGNRGIQGTLKHGNLSHHRWRLWLGDVPRGAHWRTASCMHESAGL